MNNSTQVSIPERFKPQEIEIKWQNKWAQDQTYTPDLKRASKPYYNLMMFPYPSAEGLHIGNMYAFTGVDIHGRFMRMQGFDVFEPIGLDGFGIHSENYAIKVGRTPSEHAKISQVNFYRQLHQIGNGFDWSKSLETYDPDYYRWTQWIFVEMFKHGLAYRAKAEVNWCPSCKTVLADEQVIDSKCERCSSAVLKKDLEQWFFRITAYAQRLLQNTYKPQFNWPEKVKIGQRNWIGKKEGININYQIENSSETVNVWTSRPDTNFGATFIVIAVDHPLCQKIVTKEFSMKAKSYIRIAINKPKDIRLAEGRLKTGVFTGAYAINQLNGYKMPIWISDFVLMDVGTGAVVGVPGHDKRDFEFAHAMGIPIKRVVVGTDGDTSEITRIDQVQEEAGTMMNSGFLDGMYIHEAMIKVMDYLENKGWGKRVTVYHLRDWLISRQRYWGAPIPMIYCEMCASEGKSWFTSEEGRYVGQNPKSQISNPNDQKIGNWKLEIGNSMRSMVGWYPVPEAELPVLLPDVKDWKPTGTGEGPLASVERFYETTCPECFGRAVRETDVCDTFLDSSWYYLRYPSVRSFEDGKEKLDIETRNLEVLKNQEIKNSKIHDQKNPSSYFKKSEILPWEDDVTKKWMPIDSYIGGAEHTVLHLLYTRFTWMALKDWGFLKVGQPKKAEFDPDEPFKRFFAHGLIIKDGAKMSKSKGNVVVPDELIALYGADTLRTYLMFLGRFDQGGDFRDWGIAGMHKWLYRVWRLVTESGSSHQESSVAAKKTMAKTIKGVTQDIERLHYNTAIAKLMEFTNWWMDHKEGIDSTIIKSFLLMLAPFAPHMTEELWQQIRMLEVEREKLGNDSKNLDILRNQEIKKLRNQDQKSPNSNFKSIHKEPWPTYDPKLIIEDMVTIIVQINGKLRDSLSINHEDGQIQSIVEKLTLNSAKVRKWLGNYKIKKTIFVPGKLINFVI